MKLIDRLARDKTKHVLSLGNENTCMLTLYVMQNSFGMIKVGRSTDPVARRAQIQQQVRCPVVIVNEIPMAGHREELIHLHLAKHLMGHEWFSGSEDMRKALAKLLGCPMQWPYAFDHEAAAQWFEKIKDDAVERNWRKRERQVIRNLKAAVLGIGSFGKFTDGHWILDSMIADLVGYECVSIARDQTVTGIFTGSKERVEVPRYTQLMAAAELLWLPETPISAHRPVTNAVDCCLAALCDRWCFDEIKLKPRGGR